MRDEIRSDAVQAVPPPVSSPGYSENVYFAGRLVFTMSGDAGDTTTLTSLQTDRLGTVRSSNGTARNYYPFGEEIGSSANDQYKYASTYRDSTTGLDYAVNRYYASGMGRFLSVDPDKKSAKPSNPSSWNRYTYTNDPINHRDPLGLYTYEPDPDPCIDFGYCNNGQDPCGPWGCEPDPEPTTPTEPGSSDPTAVQQFAALNADCQQGLTTAMSAGGANAEVAAQLRLNALGRAGGVTGVLAKAAGAHGIPYELLAAIGIRESGFQDIVQKGGKGVGVFQIDLGEHPEVTAAQAHDLAWAADWAANLLATNMAALAKQHPNLSSSQLLQATAASYNFGTGNISGNPGTIDVGTTGNNYGSNVMNLMGCFK